MNLVELKQSVVDARKSLNNYEHSDARTNINLCLVELGKEIDKVNNRAKTLESRVNALKFRVKKEL